MIHKKDKNIFFSCFLLACVRAIGHTDNPPQDLQTTRPNTLSDDADDIQKQLDNEARDRTKFGHPQTIWIFNIPTSAGFYTTKRRSRPDRCSTLLEKLTEDEDPASKNNSTSADDILESFKLQATFKPKEWNYKNQSTWTLTYPECGGSFQSPVNLPTAGMIFIKESRPIFFSMYDVAPQSMMMLHDGNTVSVVGNWESGKRPLIYGGAANSRRYLFHSLTYHWPAEHTVGGLYYPLESQAIHVSVEYANIGEAIQAASKDKLALLIVANIYKFSKYNQDGLENLVKLFLSPWFGNKTISARPLTAFSPPLKEYAAYHGSLTTPPCSESVLWFVRARSLPMTRELAEILHGNSVSSEMEQSYYRLVQPLNDRKIFFMTTKP